MLNTCMVLWPHSFDTASVLLPVLHLCATTMQHCSYCAALMAPASQAPALQELMYSACSAVITVCAVWKVQDQDRAAFASSAGHPVALQTVCMVLLRLTLCPQRLETSTVTADSTASSTAPGVGRGTPDSDITSSQAAWHLACAHRP